MVYAITADNFEKEVINSTAPVLVDFYADWCGPCRMLAPVLDRLAAELGATGKVCKINVDEQPDLAQQYGVMSIPTLITFEGGKQTNKAVGAQSIADLKKMMGLG